MGKGPLNGVTIVDCTSVVMGPYATSLLADLGAHVMKVEPPSGDVGRQLGPRSVDDLSALSLRLLRNKTSVVLDLSREQDAARFASLVRGADAVVTNVRPAARERLGLDFESLERLNPDIVLCTGQAFSATSSKGDLPGYDDTVQALSGMSDTYRLRDGQPGFAPSVLADKTCGLLMALSTVSALYARSAGAGGQWVDVPMVDNMASFNLVEHLSGQAFIPPLGGVGWDRSISPSRRPHRATDGWVCVMPYTDSDWQKFLRLAGRHDLLNDIRFSTMESRSEHSDLAQRAINAYVTGRTVAEVLSGCDEAQVACAPVQTLDGLVHDEYLLDRGVVEKAHHPRFGPYWDVRLPLDFNKTPLAHNRPAPTLAERGGLTE